MFSEPAQQKDISTQAGHGAESVDLGDVGFLSHHNRQNVEECEREREEFLLGQ